MSDFAVIKPGDPIPCSCGQLLNTMDAWLLAHWSETVQTTCIGCGQQYILRAGRVKKALTKSETTEEEPQDRCPECGSKEVLGQINPFWVELDEDGDMAGKWSEYEGSTEIGEKRMCSNCDHEWEI